jgi:hypothetical protein
MRRPVKYTLANFVRHWAATGASFFNRLLSRAFPKSIQVRSSSDFHCPVNGHRVGHRAFLIEPNMRHEITSFRPAFALTVVAVALLPPMVRAADPAENLSASKQSPRNVGPQYDGDGALKRPEDFRTWVFVGASLGLRYSDHASKKGAEMFNNVYLDRRAYEEYARSGTFPDKSMLAMSVYRRARKATSIQKLQGSYEGGLISLEVAVKDRSRFKEEWAYFDFSGGATAKKSAKPFPKKKCFDCHAEHAADDNVFVQFYPVLRRLMERRSAAK